MQFMDGKQPQIKYNIDNIQRRHKACNVVYEDCHVGTVPYTKIVIGGSSSIYKNVFWGATTDAVKKQNYFY